MSKNDRVRVLTTEGTVLELVARRDGSSVEVDSPDDDFEMHVIERRGDKARTPVRRIEIARLEEAAMGGALRAR